MSIRISYHARKRFAERGGASLDLQTELAGAVPFGTRPDDRRYYMKLPSGMIAAMKRDGPNDVVMTFLTREQVASTKRESAKNARKRRKEMAVKNGGSKRMRVKQNRLSRKD